MKHDYEDGANLGPPSEEYARWAAELAEANADTNTDYQGHPEPLFEAAVALAEALDEAGDDEGNS